MRPESQKSGTTAEKVHPQELGKNLRHSANDLIGEMCAEKTHRPAR